MTATTTPVWLSIADLAARYGVPERTVRGWRSRGTAPKAHKLGGHVRFRLDDVERWEIEQAEAVATDAA